MKKVSPQRGWVSTACRIALSSAILTVAVLALLLNQNSISNSTEAAGLTNAAAPAPMATPDTGSISPATATAVLWVGDKTGAPPAANGEPSCDNTALGENCDTFTLTVTGTQAAWAGRRIQIRFDWNLPTTDYDMVVRKESNGTSGMQGDGICVTGTPPTPCPTDNLDQTIGTSGNGTNTFEEAVISPADTGVGTYYVRAIYYAPNPADQYRGSASVFSVNNTLPAGTCALPTYDNYQPPVNIKGTVTPYPRRDSSAEPSIGVNWNTGNVMAMSRLRGQRATFDDSTSPADPTKVDWFSNTSPLIATGLDPILFTDQITGRTIGGELNAVAGATNAFVSDDDLSTISASFQTGGPVQGTDHQTIGGGPPNRTLKDPLGQPFRQPTTAYPHLFYYASQQIAYGAVATSFDGGITYQPAVTAYTLAQCSGLHGHIKVGLDGTVYLPNKNCGGKAAVVVSENNGLTWSVRPIPTSSAGDNDPSVGISTSGRIYVSYTASDKRPHVAVSDNRGLTWRDDFDLGLGVTPNIVSSVFPATVAGDDNRAAVFFLGTDSTRPGDPTGTDTGTIFAGTWYPYIATTCDGGKSWSVVRADNDPLHPGSNPVQQGVVCTIGTTCPGPTTGTTETRNLADFNDMTVDAKGRILAVYADGCNSDHPCYTIPKNDPTATKENNQGIARLTIIRQRGGMRLFREFDTASAAQPRLSPPVRVKGTPKGNELSWATPDDNGSPITAYRIYSGAPGKKERMVAKVNAKVHSFSDKKSGKPSVGFYYRVTAVNKFGESPRNVKAFVGSGQN